MSNGKMSLLEYLEKAQQRKELLEHYKIDTLTKEQFGKIMHADEEIGDEEAKDKIAKAVEEAGGYSCLANA